MSEEAAIARLEVQMTHLIRAIDDAKSERAVLVAKVDGIEAKLDQAAGGARVLRWFGMSSLGGAIAVCAAIYAWIKGI